MRKSWLVVIIFVALVGAVTAGVSLKLYYQVQSVGIDQPSFCNLSPTMNCEVVQASGYAAIAGLPVSGLGLCFYAFILIMALAAWVVPSTAHTVANFGWLLGAGAFLYSAFLAYISATVLRVWCPTCIVMYAVNFLLWLAWWVGGRVHPRRLMQHAGGIWKWAAAFLVIVGIGAVFMLSQARSTQHATPAQLKDALYGFQRGSVYTLPDDWSGHPVWGNPDAKVTVVEFSDYECPFCRFAALNFMPSLIDFRNDVRLVFVNYPLDQSCNVNVQMPMHKNACLAAAATLCADMQGIFWKYSEDVFRDQRRLSREMLLRLADKNHLDVAKFTECLDGPESLAQVKRDIEIAQTAQVHGTPTIFINGRVLAHWRVPEVVKGVVKSELAKVK